MRISLFNPFSSQYKALNEFPKLTLSQKVLTIALTTLATIATLFAFGLGGVATFRGLVGRFTKTPPPPVFSKPPILPVPFFERKSGWKNQTREEFFQYHLDKVLGPKNKGVAHAVNNGDCFFDSAAKTLSYALQKNISLKDVRLKIKEYVDVLDSQDPNNWVSQELQGNVDETYKSFKNNIGFTRDECVGITPVWGNKTVARLLAEVYKVKVIVYQVGSYQIDIPTMMKEKSIKGLYDEIFQIRNADNEAEVLCNEDNLEFGYHGNPLIELAAYTTDVNGHFYPVFDR